MLSSSKLQNLRVAAVAKAAMVKDGTVRTWRMQGLTFGRAVGGGTQRRYDLADAARLTLMRWLTERLRMRPEVAASATNSAFSPLTLLAMHELYRIDYPANPSRAEAADRYVMVLDRVDGSYPPEIFLREQLDMIERERIMEIRIDLNQLVEYARDNLITAIGGSALDLREKLRQAQEAPSPAPASA